MPTHWVALSTFVDESAGKFYEASGVYAQRLRQSARHVGRPLDPAEDVATCPRCGHRFASTDEDSAEEHPNLHFNGDDDIPSICAEALTQ